MRKTPARLDFPIVSSEELVAVNEPRHFEPWSSDERTTTELAPFSPNFHTTPTGRRLSLTYLKSVGPLYTAGLQRYKAQTPDVLATSPKGCRSYYGLDELQIDKIYLLK
ncbi:hypothetical protein TNCV_992401 [Trichonephila clavipes]|nr:hypothetical protein TNCV_992401 [Trichonephila clavipes]